MLVCKAPCASPQVWSLTNLCGKVGGGQPYLPCERQCATLRGKGATGLQRKCCPSDQEERYKEPCKKSTHQTWQTVKSSLSWKFVFELSCSGCTQLVVIISLINLTNSSSLQNRKSQQMVFKHANRSIHQKARQGRQNFGEVLETNLILSNPLGWVTNLWHSLCTQVSICFYLVTDVILNRLQLHLKYGVLYGFLVNLIVLIFPFSSCRFCSQFNTSI